MKQRTLAVLCAVAFVAALPLACTSSKSPAAPTPPPVESSSGLDGAALKVTAPTPVSPINDQKLTDLNSPLTATASAGTYTTVSGLQYDFEVYNDANAKIQTDVVSSPSFKLSGNLENNKRYTWRVRAAMVAQKAYGPWSAFGSFVTPDNTGYIRGNELYDPLTNGKSVGAVFDCTFTPDGIRLNGIESYVEYQLQAPLTDGEFSVIITNLGNSNEPWKTKVMSMLQGDGVNITDNAYRFTADRRNADSSGTVRYTLRSRSVDAGEPNGGGASWSRSHLYLWQYTWRNGNSNLQVRDGGVNGATFKNFGAPYKAPYAPSPHIIRLGSVKGRGGSESLPGATFRNLWVSSNPRPALVGDNP